MEFSVVYKPIIIETTFVRYESALACGNYPYTPSFGECTGHLLPYSLEEAPDCPPGDPHPLPRLFLGETYQIHKAKGFQLRVFDGDWVAIPWWMWLE